MKFEDSHAAVVVGDGYGIYIANQFAKLFELELRQQTELTSEDVDILLAGPDHEEYVEVYAELFPVTLTGIDGRKFVFTQVGESADVWEIPLDEYEQIEWDEL